MIIKRKTLATYFLLLLCGLLAFSCNKSDDTNPPEIDFVYSMSYINDSTYMEICASSTCNQIPAASEFRWYFNGSLNNFPRQGLGACDIYDRNGSYALSLVVTTPDGIQYSKGINFEVTGIK